MILIWVDESNKKTFEALLSLIKKKNKVELIFEEDSAFYAGYFSPSMLTNKKKVYYCLPSNVKKLSKRYRKHLKNAKKSQIKNEFVRMAIETFKRPLFYTKIKYIRKKETIAKRFLETNKIILFYKSNLS